MHAKTEQGYTPLLLAAYYGRVLMVSLLLDRGAKLEAKTRQGFTALCLAAEQVGDACTDHTYSILAVQLLL